jgi:hypothetical protein
MTKEEFKSLFLKLTEYTIPFGDEDKLESILPSGYQKDSTGNYYYEIGNSETLFTTHLDTFSAEYEKVNHVIDEKDPYIIRTDETTILGGDNKLGCTILIGMIKNNIPGTYYFFLGEEPIISGGLYGSSNALEERPEYFEKFKRCIAFDRREYGSIVVRQMARMCCSKEFAMAMADELKRLGDIHWDEEGGYGYYTDTAVFMDVIEECTNISAGGFREHYKDEWVDLNYTYKVYQTALKIDFENLPTVREIEERFNTSDDSKSKVNQFDKFTQDKNQKEISNIFKKLGLSITRSMSKDGKHHLTFSKWLEDYDFDVYLVGSKIILNEKEVSMSELKKEIIDIFANDIIEEVEYYLDLIEDGDKKAIKSLNDILNIFNCKSIQDLENLLNS